MKRYEDAADPANGSSHHTGKVCVEKGCERPAGTQWSPFWCQPCNAARMNRISGFLHKELKWYEAGGDPPRPPKRTT